MLSSADRQGSGSLGIGICAQVGVAVLVVMMSPNDS